MEIRWLIVLLLIAGVVVTRPSIHGNDGVQNYAYLRSLLFDGDLDFTNEYTYYYSRAPHWFDEKQISRDAVTGRPINLYGIGSAILWAPWVLTFHGLGWLGVRLGWQGPLDGYSCLYEYGVGYGSAFYASVGLVLVSVVLARSFGCRASFWSTVVIWLGTPLFFYGWIHPSMSHANSFFLSSLLMYLYFSRRQNLANWALMGCVSGFLVLTRFQDGILLVALVVAQASVLVGVWQKNRLLVGRWLQRQLLRWLVFGVMMIGVSAMQGVVWWKLHGSPLSGPRGYLSQGHVNLLFPRHIGSALLSAFHGLFHWHPILFLGIVGLLWQKNVGRRLRVFCVTGFVAQAWVVGSWSIWWAGASLGQRMFISVFPHLAVGLAATFSSVKQKHRWVVPAVACLALAWNFGLVVQYATHIIPRQAPVSILALAKNNVVDVPRVFVRTIQGVGDTTATRSFRATDR